MGRSAEISITRYEESRFDYEEEMWCLQWPESKTCGIKIIPFCHDFKFVYDIYLCCMHLIIL
jgi:hypothetical protein